MSSITFLIHNQNSSKNLTNVSLKDQNTVGKGLNNQQFDNITTIKLIITFNIELPIVDFKDEESVDLIYPNIERYKNIESYKITKFHKTSDNTIIIDDNITTTFYYYLIKKTNINDIYKLSQLDLRSFYIIPNISNNTLTYSHINDSDYYILKIEKNIVPNLYNYMSYSHNSSLISLSSINDYIFTKPFILFKNTILYFYNINFKINPTSIIKLDNNDINIHLPISTEQFFINTQNKNITFDEFNLNSDKVKNYVTLKQFIDTLLNQINININIDEDINNIIELIKNVNDLYYNIFNNMFNDINKFGLTTSKILNYLPKINKLDILNISNTDYSIYSHNIINYNAFNNILATIDVTKIIDNPDYSFTINRSANPGTIKFNYY
jgi:hypothetical protein